MSDEDVNKLVGTSESCQLPVSHQTTANFPFTKYEWVRKVGGMSRECQQLDVQWVGEDLNAALSTGDGTTKHPAM